MSFTFRCALKFADYWLPLFSMEAGVHDSEKFGFEMLQFHLYESLHIAFPHTSVKLVYFFILNPTAKVSVVVTKYQNMILCQCYNLS